MALSITPSEAVLSGKQAKGPRRSHPRVVDPQTDPRLFGILHCLSHQGKRPSRSFLLGEVAFFWEAFLSRWTVRIQNSPGGSHLFPAGGWFAAPQKHTQCKKTCGELGNFFFCRFSRTLHASNQPEECWSHVSVRARTVLCTAESSTDSVRDRVTYTTVNYLLPIFSLGPWRAYFKSTDSQETVSDSLSTTCLTRPFCKHANKQPHWTYLFRPSSIYFICLAGPEDGSGCGPNENFICKLMAHRPTQPSMMYFVWPWWCFQKKMWVVNT